MPSPAPQRVTDKSGDRIITSVEVLFGLVFLTLISVQIFKPPFIGLADNGDFPKVTGRLSIGPKGPYEKFVYFTSDYVHSPRYRWKGPVVFSELFPAWIATSFVRNIRRTKDFDIRYLGAMHLVLLASAYYLLLSLLKSSPISLRLGMPALVIWIFSDAAYTAYLNSFYSDVTALLGLLLMLVSALHLVVKPNNRWGMWTIFSIATLLFITSKAQHGLWGIFPAAFALVITHSKKGRIRIVGTTLCLAFLASTVTELLITPSSYKGQALYNLIFFKIAQQSITPAQDLSALGLPQEDSRYIGSTAYDRGSPAGNSIWLRSFYENVGYKGIARFYLLNPRRALDILQYDLGSAAQIRPHQLANYRRADGVPPHALKTEFTSWSRLRSHLFVWWPLHILAWHMAVISVVILILGCYEGEVRRWIAAICGSISCMAVLEYSFASLTDAIETNRHLFLFNTLTDLTVCFAVAAVLYGAEPAIERLARPASQL